MAKQLFSVKDGKVTIKGVVLRKGLVWIRGETHLRIARVYPSDECATVETRVGTVGRYTKETEKVDFKELARYTCHQAE